MRPLRNILLCAFLVIPAACADDDDDDDVIDAGDDEDASVDPPDADPGAPDSGPDYDATPVPDAAPVPDASGSIGEVCADLCDDIDACFGAEPGCEAECADALVVCSEAELEDLAACTDLPCDAFEECFLSVPCVGGGGPVCGDGTCDVGESCGTCATDCGTCVCGDGTCSPGECSTCEADCPGGCSCPHDECTVGDILDVGCSDCVIDICAVDAYCCDTFWDELCVSEAETICGKDCPDVCGDGICSPGEDKTCEIDCGGPPPGGCGDGVCDEFESCAFCEADCGACVCGDGTCSPGECSTCAADCPGGCSCPHDECTVGDVLDPGCSDCVVDICAVDSYCCEFSWDSLCVGEAESICGKDCPSFCGDGICDPGEDMSCKPDCFGGDPGDPPTPE